MVSDVTEIPSNKNISLIQTIWNRDSCHLELMISTRKVWFIQNCVNEENMTFAKYVAAKVIKDFQSRQSLGQYDIYSGLSKISKIIPQRYCGMYKLF